jgi:FeS assembly SUF system protein
MSATPHRPQPSHPEGGRPAPRQPEPWPSSPPPAAKAPPPAAPQPAAPAAASPPAASAPPAPAPAASGKAAPTPPFAPGTLEPDIIAALRTCFDPEIPLNIYDMNLIYGIDVDPEGNVQVRMTLTSPTCPVAGTLPGEAQQKIAGVPGVKSAHVALVWDPPWEPSMLSEAARLQLGIP